MDAMYLKQVSTVIRHACVDVIVPCVQHGTTRLLSAADAVDERLLLASALRILGDLDVVTQTVRQTLRAVVAPYLRGHQALHAIPQGYQAPHAIVQGHQAIVNQACIDV